jgi:hypothetical protein
MIESPKLDQNQARDLTKSKENIDAEESIPNPINHAGNEFANLNLSATSTPSIPASNEIASSEVLKSSTGEEPTRTSHEPTQEEPCVIQCESTQPDPDFDEFAEFSKPSDENDFGDFEEFSSGNTFTTANPVKQAVLPPHENNLPRVLQNILSKTNLDTLETDINQFLDISLPAESESTPFHLREIFISDVDGQEYTRIRLNPKLIDAATEETLTQLSKEPLYDENISQRITWRRCFIRKLFLASLDIPMDLEDNALLSKTEKKFKSTEKLDPEITIAIGEGPPTNKTSIESKKNSNLDPIQLPDVVFSPLSPLPDVETISKLVQLGDDELKSASVQQLMEYKKTLSSALHGLHAQINYYLDAREQLQLDAEMHNKMISALVQQAQKTHERIKKGKGLFAIRLPSGHRFW